VALEGESAGDALPRVASEEADAATGRGLEGVELPEHTDMFPISPCTFDLRLPQIPSRRAPVS